MDWYTNDTLMLVILNGGGVITIPFLAIVKAYVAMFIFNIIESNISIASFEHVFNLNDVIVT